MLRCAEPRELLPPPRPWVASDTVLAVCRADSCSAASCVRREETVALRRRGRRSRLVGDSESCGARWWPHRPSTRGLVRPPCTLTCPARPGPWRRRGRAALLLPRLLPRLGERGFRGHCASSEVSLPAVVALLLLLLLDMERFRADRRGDRRLVGRRCACHLTAPSDTKRVPVPSIASAMAKAVCCTALGAGAASLRRWAASRWGFVKSSGSSCLDTQHSSPCSLSERVRPVCCCEVGVLAMSADVV